jgi:hypothetical protein
MQKVYLDVQHRSSFHQVAAAQVHSARPLVYSVNLGEGNPNWVGAVRGAGGKHANLFL